MALGRAATATASAMAVSGISGCRGSDRQRGDACREEYPGQHGNSPSNGKTVRSLHRSNT
jgi:hypothetical protein